MAPTILALCGEAVPSYMEGRALSECFAQPLAVSTVPFAWDAREAGDAYTAEGAATVEKRLADLTEHMETVLQTYLRNEFPTIDDYNEFAGEVAEPYRVVVVANFPVNFTEVALRRLASIASE